MRIVVTIVSRAPGGVNSDRLLASIFIQIPW